MGLYDRNYMNEENRPPENARGMLFGIIIVNALIYLFDAHTNFSLAFSGKVTPATLVQCITAGFTHKEFGHLFFNMWGLYLFGSLLVPYMDKWKFLGLYIAGVIVGNGLYLACNIYSKQFVLLGASGAVYAIMAGAATMEPDRKFMMLFFPVPVKTTTLVIVYTLMDILFFAIDIKDSNIAHLAHLGGLAGGYIMMKIYFGNNLAWDPLRLKRKPFSTGYITPEPEKEKPFSPGTPGTPVSQKELDYLLDKLSRDGINALSEAELERLRQARRQMRGE